MLLRILPVLWLFLLAPFGASAAEPADVSAALRLSDVISVMHDEGIGYGDELRGELFPEAAGARWSELVGGIYDETRMQLRFSQAFERRLGDDPDALQVLVDFFASDRGQRIVGLEIDARRALLDDSVEEAAKGKLEAMRADRDPRLDLLEKFAATNDLIEENVAGSLNANLAFYQSMADAGAFGADGMSQDNILSDVWSQEPEVRTETEAWLYPYLAMAYGPLSDDDLQAYIAFSETPEAQVLNEALFGAFDEVFVQISGDLGRAAAGVLAGQDI
ncbi:MAG: hypothetical protein DI533_18335 [Cereibacter sphaeroides]|uniref:Uncharacterized protein n=1 Tax=Cereibacter sphaeroides TaxID=1063 RepID=A0A2W5S1X0_CERSP|nr:MAG: hypothetical protein DI533_18335 [Cereibacter sphaeroides]